jgi:hypothetical protein
MLLWTWIGIAVSAAVALSLLLALIIGRIIGMVGRDMSEVLEAETEAWMTLPPAPTRQAETVRSRAVRSRAVRSREDALVVKG